MLFILFVEWPVYFERGEPNKKKINGNINILQLGSNVTEYTILLELYNFVNNPRHLIAIGQKLKSIFAMDVNSITGCNHKSDYTLLRKQYPNFNLPTSEIYAKFDDVGLMARNRGIVQKGRGNNTLQSLCRGQAIQLKKPEHVRVGSCFASKQGSLSTDAQKYCQLDVEAVLRLYTIYSNLPDLTMRLSRDVIPPVGSIVDIMPECGASVTPIAQGVIRQMGSGTWSTNGIRLTKKTSCVSC